jgi:hypothetical protein
VSAQSLDHKNLGDLNAMIKALESLKESRPNISFVKTGVSSAEIPRFLVDKDIIQESKRTYAPTPMALDVANTDRDLNVLKIPEKTKRPLKKSKRLNLIKERSVKQQVALQGQREASVAAKKIVKKTQRQYKRGFWHWLEELAIIMSKMSLFGLFLILMLLGTVFFGVGFLAAVSNVQEKPTSHPNWQQASACHTASGGGGKPNPFLKAAGGVASTLVDQKVASIESKLGGGFLNKAVEKVPPSLQPFALQMQNKFAQSSQAVVSSGGRAIKGAFRPSRFGDTPPPPPPAQVATSTPPAYHPIFGTRQSQPITAGQPPSMHQLNPSQKSFQQAGQVYDKAMATPQSAPIQAQGYAQPQQPMAYGYQPQYGQVQPQPQAYAPQPVYTQPQGYQQPPVVVSQPYGASQPYGYNQAPVQEQPKFIGMG